MVIQHLMMTRKIV